MGDGNVGGILSVDISDWDTAGEYSAKGKLARECTREEIADEVWAQLKAALNDGTTVLRRRVARDWFLDPAIVYPNPTQATNLEPLLVNTAGSWAHRPTAALPEIAEPLPRLGLRPDLHRPGDDGGRQRGRAPSRQRDPRRRRDRMPKHRVGVWSLRDPGGLPFAAARAIDRLIYRLPGGHGPPPTIAVRDGALALNPVPRLRSLLRRA